MDHTHHDIGFDLDCPACNAQLPEQRSPTVTLERRSPVERAGYMLACLARGTTSVGSYDAAMGVLAAEAIVDATLDRIKQQP